MLLKLTILMIYFIFRKEELQLHELDYCEVLEEAFEEEIVVEDIVAYDKLCITPRVSVRSDGRR